VILLVGESGSGKTATERALERKGFKRIISYTTRPMREGEEDGVSYYFTEPMTFLELVDAGFFAEWVKYNGNYYGTAKMDCVDDRVIVVEPEGLKQLQENIELKTISFYLKASEAF
jgi:guanylate kinase